MSVDSRDVITMRDYVDTRMDAHQREHEQIETALRRAEQEMDRRLVAMNELRDQINRERSLYVTRDVLDGIVGSLALRILAVERPVWIAIALVGLASFAVPILLSLAK